LQTHKDLQASFGQTATPLHILQARGNGLCPDTSERKHCYENDRLESAPCSGSAVAQIAWRTGQKTTNKIKI